MSALVIAHRGAKVEAAENTMAAFERAVDAGADMIELDVRMTGDGVPVVMHDETIDRTTDRSGRVSDMTLSALQEAKVKDDRGEPTDEPVPTLEQVLAFARGTIGLNIEIKQSSEQLVDRISTLIDATDFPLSDLIISSFDITVIHWIDQRRRDLSLAPLYSKLPSDFSSMANTLPGRFIHVHYRGVDDASMEAMTAAKKKVNVWTVNDRDEQERLLRLGVNGIITDDPRALRALLQSS